MLSAIDACIKFKFATFKFGDLYTIHQIAKLKTLQKFPAIRYGTRLSVYIYAVCVCCAQRAHKKTFDHTHVPTMPILC